MAAPISNNNTPLPMSRIFVFAWLVLLMVAGAIVRVQGVEYYHYNADEAHHIYTASGSTLAETLRFSLYDTHPPLGHLLRHYWLMMDTSPVFARGLSLLFGIALIPLYFLIGRRLGGDLTGLILALLVAFSHGCIIQSYAVRNYTIFLFFLSVSFYWYLRWRESCRMGALLGYGGFGVLACLTHFSGIFAYSVIAVYEAVILCRHCRPWVAWALTHLAAALIILPVYWIGQSGMLMPIRAYLHYTLPPSLWEHLWYYMLGTASYLIPYRTGNAPLYVLGGVVLLALLCMWRRKTSPMPVALTLMALALGGVLFGSALYPFAGGRHHLWMLPFFIAAIGWAVTEGCLWVCSVTHGRVRTWHIIIVLAVTVGMISRPVDRFTDTGEYMMPEVAWQGLSHTLDTLDAAHLVVSDRTNIFLMTRPDQNPYRYFNEQTFTGTSRIRLMPARNTRILFDPFDLRIPSGAVLLAMMQEAQEQGILREADTLVFVSTLWSSPPVDDLILCPVLKKKVMTFPEVPPPPLTQEALSRIPVALLMVSKKDFFEQVMSPTGSARRCLH